MALPNPRTLRTPFCGAHQKASRLCILPRRHIRPPIETAIARDSRSLSATTALSRCPCESSLLAHRQAKLLHVATAVREFHPPPRGRAASCERRSWHKIAHKLFPKLGIIYARRFNL